MGLDRRHRGYNHERKLHRPSPNGSYSSPGDMTTQTNHNVLLGGVLGLIRAISLEGGRKGNSLRGGGGKGRASTQSTAPHKGEKDLYTPPPPTKAATDHSCQGSTTSESSYDCRSRRAREEKQTPPRQSVGHAKNGCGGNQPGQGKWKKKRKRRRRKTTF